MIRQEGSNTFVGDVCPKLGPMSHGCRTKVCPRAGNPQDIFKFWICPVGGGISDELYPGGGAGVNWLVLKEGGQNAPLPG